MNEINETITVRGTMPGHKGKILLDGGHDVTELTGADNLQKPAGIIRAAEERAAQVYGTAFARYLVNGSSGGNLTLLFSFFREGDSILVERNCHKSVFNGILLRKLKPVYLWPAFDAWGNALPQSAQQVEEALEHHPEVKGVLLTLPSYKGFVSDYERIYSVTGKAGVPLLIDAAHGAALAGMEGFEHFYTSCDAMVISAHKSLACLNQGSLILGNRPADQPVILKYSNMFQTTSPSYLIMESIEEAVEELAAGKYLDPPDLVGDAYSVLRLNPKADGLRMDPWKLLIHAPGSGDRMEDFLEACGIYPEMHDPDSVLMMLSPCNGPEETEYLRACLAKLDAQLHLELTAAERPGDVPSTRDPSDRIPVPAQRLLPWQVEDGFREIPLRSAAGSTAQEQVIPYPPGIPILLPGEVIDEAMVEYIELLSSQDIEIIGMHDGRLRCIEEEQDGHTDRH